MELILEKEKSSDPGLNEWCYIPDQNICNAPSYSTQCASHWMGSERGLLEINHYRWINQTGAERSTDPVSLLLRFYWLGVYHTDRNSYYFVPTASQYFQRSLEVFFFHKNVICVICWNSENPYLILCEDTGQFWQNTNQRKVENALYTVQTKQNGGPAPSTKSSETRNTSVMPFFRRPIPQTSWIKPE